MSPELLAMWAGQDKDIAERLGRCQESYSWRGGLIAQELRILRDENLALLKELATREEQVCKLANALTVEVSQSMQ